MVESADEPAFFNLEKLTWHADAIVIGTEGSTIDGLITAQKVVFGTHIQATETIRLPGFEAVAHTDLPDNKRTTQLTGQRFIAFLKKKDDGWFPALGSDWRTCTAWLENDEAISWRRISSTHLEAYYLHLNEFMLKSLTKSVLAHRHKFQKAIKHPKPSTRAKALIDLLPLHVANANDLIFSALIDCGSEAEPYLIKALANPNFIEYKNEFIDLLGTQGTKHSREFLGEFIDQEYLFWYRHATSLTQRWWRNSNISYQKRRNLENRFDHLCHAILALSALRDQASNETILILRDFWRTVPHLNDERFTSLVSLCDDYLQTVASKK